MRVDRFMMRRPVPCPGRVVARTLAFALVIAGCVASPAAAALGDKRPYDVLSAWNVPIGSNPVISPRSLGFVESVTDNNLALTSDVDQYAIPVYFFDDRTPRSTVQMGGYYSTYDAGDDSRVGYGFAPTIDDVPIPAGALSSAGSDGQIVIWNPDTGVEYSFWQFAKDASGYVATNGYRYHSTSGYYGRMDDGKAGRGAGTPYLAGLVRPWEIARGRIDHALAFAYDSPSSDFVYPASKSDGGGTLGSDLPEGSRLQLDPSLDEKDFKAWGLNSTAKVIARALQRYGMYVIDNGGSSKLYLEDRITANWGPSVDRHLPENIPLKDFRVVKGPGRPEGSGGTEGCSDPTAVVSPGQRAQTRTAIVRVAKALRSVKASRMRSRSGPRIRVKMHAGSSVRVTVTGSVGGRRLVLSRGKATGECGRAYIRLRPTATGRRHLRAGRRLVVGVRLRARGHTKATAASRRLRLHR